MKIIDSMRLRSSVVEGGIASPEVDRLTVASSDNGLPSCYSLFLHSPFTTADFNIIRGWAWSFAKGAVWQMRRRNGPFSRVGLKLRKMTLYGISQSFKRPICTILRPQHSWPWLDSLALN